MEKKSVLQGFAIVVVDRGFVYVGEIQTDGGWTVVTDARNIRVWGTTDGLGQLALQGPQKDTVLDDCGTVRVPQHALITLIDTDGAKWKR